MDGKKENKGQDEADPMLASTVQAGLDSASVSKKITEVNKKDDKGDDD